MPKTTVSQSPQQPHKRRHSEEVRQRAIELLMQGKGRSVVADELDISESTLGPWLAQHRKSLGHVPAQPKRFSEEQKQRAMTTAQEEGLESAAKAIGAGRHTVYAWLKEAGLKYKGHRGERGRHTRVSHDRDFSWMREDLPEYEAWRVLATRWIQEQAKNLRGKMLALRRFFQDYLRDTVEKAGLLTSPTELLARSTLLPDFFNSTLKSYKPSVGRIRNNYVYEFLNWVLLTELSVPDDHGRPVVSPQFHNPVQRRARGGGGQNAESVRSPLPYGYIDELRGMLAGGPTFADWK